MSKRLIKLDDNDMNLLLSGKELEIMTYDGTPNIIISKESLDKVNELPRHNHSFGKFEIKKPKLSFLSYLIGLKLVPFKPTTVMLYEMPDYDIPIKELWKWCRE